MEIDIYFSRHWKEDFPKIKKNLLDIVGEDNVTLVMEGNQLNVSNEVLLNNDIETFQKEYYFDLLGKKQIENNPQIISLLLKKMESIKMPESNYSANDELYGLVVEMGWDLRFEFTPLDILFNLQKAYLVPSIISHSFNEPNEEYLGIMRDVFETTAQLIFNRDGLFFNQLKLLESEGRKIISARGSLHSYMIDVVGEQGINFHGNIKPIFMDYETNIYYKFLKCDDVTDEDLVRLHREHRSDIKK